MERIIVIWISLDMQVLWTWEKMLEKTEIWWSRDVPAYIAYNRN
jgi:hypothetical protein